MVFSPLPSSLRVAMSECSIQVSPPIVRTPPVARVKTTRRPLGAKLPPDASSQLAPAQGGVSRREVRPVGRARSRPWRWSPARVKTMRAPLRDQSGWSSSSPPTGRVTWRSPVPSGRMVKRALEECASSR